MNYQIKICQRHAKNFPNITSVSVFLCQDAVRELDTYPNQFPGALEDALCKQIDDWLKEKRFLNDIEHILKGGKGTICVTAYSLTEFVFAKNCFLGGHNGYIDLL